MQEAKAETLSSRHMLITCPKSKAACGAVCWVCLLKSFHRRAERCTDLAWVALVALDGPSTCVQHKYPRIGLCCFTLSQLTRPVLSPCDSRQQVPGSELQPSAPAKTACQKAACSVSSAKLSCLACPRYFCPNCYCHFSWFTASKTGCRASEPELSSPYSILAKLSTHKG